MKPVDDLRDYRIVGMPILVFMVGLAAFGIALTAVAHYFLS